MQFRTVRAVANLLIPFSIIMVAAIGCMEEEKTEYVGGGTPVGPIAMGGQSGEPQGPNGVGASAGTIVDPGTGGTGGADEDAGPGQGGSMTDADPGPADAGMIEETSPATDAGVAPESGAADASTNVDEVATSADAGVTADADVTADAGAAADAASVDSPPADGAAEASAEAPAQPDAGSVDSVEGGPAPGPDSVVTLFTGKYLFYGNDNTRRGDAYVTFPTMPALYDRITLRMSLTCPAGGCDQVEKRGFLGVVRQSPQGAESVTEMLRFISPAGVQASWTADLTDLRPLLTGAVTVRVFVETWVGPGSQGGAGYVVDASVDFHGGRPARRPIAVIPVWDETSFVHGDPGVTGAAAVAPRKVTLPAGTRTVDLRSIITGHGQGNLDGCGAFCKKSHRFVVGATAFDSVIWRDDCASTAPPGQQGAWTAARAGWCPGTPTYPWVVDVTAAMTGAETPVTYAIADYANTCRPSAPVCTGCTMGASCAYNGGTHTPPTYFVSALLIAYGD